MFLSCLPFTLKSPTCLCLLLLSPPHTTTDFSRFGCFNCYTHTCSLLIPPILVSLSLLYQKGNERPHLPYPIYSPRNREGWGSAKLSRSCTASSSGCTSFLLTQVVLSAHPPCPSFDGTCPCNWLPWHGTDSYLSSSWQSLVVENTKYVDGWAFPRNTKKLWVKDLDWIEMGEKRGPAKLPSYLLILSLQWRLTLNSLCSSHWNILRSAFFTRPCEAHVLPFRGRLWTSSRAFWYSWHTPSHTLYGLSSCARVELGRQQAAWGHSWWSRSRSTVPLVRMAHSFSGNSWFGSSQGRLTRQLPVHAPLVQVGAGLFPSLRKEPVFLKDLRAGSPSCLHYLATSLQYFQGCREESSRGADFWQWGTELFS